MATTQPGFNPINGINTINGINGINPANNIFCNQMNELSIIIQSCKNELDKLHDNHKNKCIDTYKNYETQLMKLKEDIITQETAIFTVYFDKCREIENKINHVSRLYTTMNTPTAGTMIPITFPTHSLQFLANNSHVNPLQNTLTPNNPFINNIFNNNNGNTVPNTNNTDTNNIGNICGTHGNNVGNSNSNNNLDSNGNNQLQNILKLNQLIGNNPLNGLNRLTQNSNIKDNNPGMFISLLKSEMTYNVYIYIFIYIINVVYL